MMNSGNSERDGLTYTGMYSRYFGKDLTNLEQQQYAQRENSQPFKSTLKSSGRDLKVKPSAKPTPIQFYKEIFKNQRLLHKRSQTNDGNRSGSVDIQEQSKSKGNFDAKDSLNLIPKGDTGKLQLTKFLKVNSKGGYPSFPIEPRQESQIVIQEFPQEQRVDSNFDFKSSINPSTQNYSGKFASIPSLIPASLQQSKVLGLSRQTPTGHHSMKFQNSDFQKQLKPRPDKSNKNFQYLRLNLEDGQRSTPKQESMKKESSNKSDVNGSIQNELDEINICISDNRSELLRQFDIPFIWEYLLSQEVVYSYSEKYVLQRVFRQTL